MHISSPRKVFHGVATRHDMYRLFNRHQGAPAVEGDDTGNLFAGEWFEIAEAEYDHMFEILPPLFMRGDMFALREFLTDSITSVFFALQIDGRVRWFHGYCDLSDRTSPDAMKAAIVERGSWPVRAMTRAERLDHIWSSTSDKYRGYAGEGFPEALRGGRTVHFYGGGRGMTVKLLDQLTEDEISAKLPVHLRHLPERIAA